MADIKITFTGGEIREFRHVGRPGGSYTKRLSLEFGFVIIEDEYGKRLIFPSHTIVDIQETPNR